MVPTHGTRNLATVAALAARVSAGDAGGAEGSIIGQQGPSCRCCNVVHVCGCGCAQLCLEPCSGCRCMSVLHVAVCCGGRVAQLWHWGSSVHCAACLLARNGSARACRSLHYVERPRRKTQRVDLEKFCPGSPFEPSFSPSSWPAPLQHDAVSPARCLTCGPVA